MSEHTTQNEYLTIIEPTRGWRSLNLREVWERRELLWFLAWRDVKVRYKQTALGLSWAVIAPLAGMFVFSTLFGRIAHMPSDGLPSSVFYMAGLVLWRYFARSLETASNSLVGNMAVLTKVYYPRLITPLSACLSGLVDLAVAFCVLLLVAAWHGVIPGWTSLLAPLWVLMALLSSLGVGLALSAVNVKYRDVAQAVPFLTQLWMYATIVIPFSQLPERFGYWRYLYGLNPMAGAVEAFRWCLFRHTMQAGGAPIQPPWLLLAAGVPVMAAMLLFGLLYFKRMERTFADIL